MPDVPALAARPFLFTNVGAPVIDAAQVNSDFTWLEGKVIELIAAINDLDAANMATAMKPTTLLGRWDTVLESTGAGNISLNNAQHYILQTGAGVALNGASAGLATMWYPDAADFAVSGLTAKLRVVGYVQTNGTAPAVTFTFGLHQVSAAGGGANAHTLTINTTAVAGSTVAIASPVANGTHHANGSAFAMPSTGPTTAYCFGLAANGTMAANSSVRLSARLELRYE